MRTFGEVRSAQLSRKHDVGEEKVEFTRRENRQGRASGSINPAWGLALV